MTAAFIAFLVGIAWAAVLAAACGIGSEFERRRAHRLANQDNKGTT